MTTDDLESRVAQLERSPESLRCQLTATQQLLAERTRERDLASKAAEDARDGRDGAWTRLDDLGERYDAEVAKRQKLHVELETMTAERDALQANLQDIIEERDHLLAVEVQHETDLAAMKAKLDAARSDRDRIWSDLSNRTIERDRAIHQRYEFKVRLDELTDERDAALAKIATLQMDLRILRDEASVTVADRERLRDKLDALRTREPTDYELSQVVCVAIDGARSVWCYVRQALLSEAR